jgi:two-component system, sensor histidine kinase PdtaS
MPKSLAAAGCPTADGEAQFRAFADGAPVMFWRSGPDRLCDFVNSLWLEFTGRSLEQELGSGWSDGIHPDDLQRWLTAYAEAFDSRQDFTIDYRLRGGDGRYRWVRANGRPDWRGGAFGGFLVSGIDIDDRIAAEHQLAGSLRENQSLLQEVLHRSKNNIQLVLSLLRLQERRTGDPAVKRQLGDGIGRVQAVALAQAQFARPGTAGEVDLGEYLRNLVNAVNAQYGRPGLEIELSTEPVAIAGQRAIPFGVMMNELVANAYQHGFPDGRAGRISIRGEIRDGVAVLTVADDGRGLPAGAFPGQGKLGFQLILGIAGQIGAKIQTDEVPTGTRFTIRLPITDA